MQVDETTNLQGLPPQYKLTDVSEHPVEASYHESLDGAQKAAKKTLGNAPLTWEQVGNKWHGYGRNHMHIFTVEPGHLMQEVSYFLGIIPIHGDIHWTPFL